MPPRRQPPRGGLSSGEQIPPFPQLGPRNWKTTLFRDRTLRLAEVVRRPPDLGRCVQSGPAREGRIPARSVVNDAYLGSSRAACLVSYLGTPSPHAQARGAMRLGPA